MHPSAYRLPFDERRKRKCRRRFESADNASTTLFYSRMRGYMKDKKNILLPIWGATARIFLVLVMIYTPKVVLDLLEQRAEITALLESIAVFGMFLAAASVNNAVAHNTLEEYSQTMLYKHWIGMWEKKVMELDYEVFTSSSGKLLTEKARNVVSSPNWGIVTYLPRLTLVLENMAGLLTFSAIIGTLHPLILVLLLVIFCIEIWCTRITEKKKHALQEERASANRKLNYLAYGTKGMQEGKDIRIYAMVPWLQEITKQVILQKDEVEKKAAGFQLQRLLLTGLLILLRDGAAYLYLIYSFLYEDMSLGDFTLYFAAITGLGNWLTGLVESIGQFVEAKNYVRDFRQFLELDNAEGGIDAASNTTEIIVPISFTFENVSFSYTKEEEKQELPILKNINLTIHPGEKLAIVGVNGAGKTTLVKLLCGMLKPKTGRVLVNGQDSRSISKEAYWKLFSAVFQSSGVLPVSIAENIMLNIRKEADKSVMWDCIRLAGLEKKIMSLSQKEMTPLVKRITEQGTELSGGELQRLLLARALYKDAPVLVLDEPTAALDPLAESEIYEKYHQLTQGKTAVFISHRLASTRFCDRIVMLEQGEIIEMGTHEELLSLGGKYAEMFQVQSHYYQEESEVACS